MMNIENDGNIVIIEDDELINGVKIVKLASPLTLSSNEVKELQSKVKLSCSEDYERIFFFGEINADEDYFVSIDSKTVDKVNEIVDLGLNFSNFLSESVTINAGTEIGRIYKSYIEGLIDINHATGLNIYNDDKISCKSIDNKMRKFELYTTPEGTKTIKIDIDSEE